MTQWPYILLAFFGGVVLPIQIGINATLAKKASSAIWAAGLSFAVGTIGLIVFFAIQRTDWPARAALAEAPWWAWVGGLLGAFYVASTITVAPKLDATLMIGLIIGGQLVMAVILDHFGWLGYTQHPINPMRLLGVALLIGGVLLIKKF